MRELPQEKYRQNYVDFLNGAAALGKETAASEAARRARTKWSTLPPVERDEGKRAAGAGNPGGIGDELFAACREVIAPLIHADGGHLYIVSSSAGELHLHLTGTCAGCPGASTTRDRIIQPAIASCAPGMQIKLTTGWTVPTGATKVEPS